MGDPADDKPRAPRPGTPPRSPTPTAHEGPTAAKKVERPSVRPGGPKALIGLTISDRYRIERLLGEGGMGVVYQAEHTLMRKRMAIKVLHPEMTRLPEVVARFEREAMAAAHIDHPHVVTATDFGKLDDGSFFLALEFVEGRSLREVIAQGRLELGRALHIARQIAAALQRAHALKIVHRDLKPENVLLVERDGDPDFVKVLDFGIAKVPIGELTAETHGGPGQPVLTQAGMVYGTPEYMAPEQALGQPVDARADLYALGVITYEMLTGSRPFEAESKVALLGMQVTAPVPPMSSKSPDANVPPEVEALVGRLLAKEASERLAEAREVIEGIIGIMAQLVATGRIDPTYAPPPGSGVITNPGIISGITPAPPELATAPRPAPAADKSLQALLAGKGWLVAAGAGTLGILVLVVTIAIVFRGRGTDATTTTDAGPVVLDLDDPNNIPSVPLDDRVKDAIALIERGDYGSGIQRLEELGEQVKGREDVHRALLTAYSATNRPKEAMREARLVLESDQDIVLREEVKLRVAVRDTALKHGSADATTKEAVDDAFSILTERMGTQGWDDLYDVAYGTAGQNYPKAAARAKTTLQRGQRAKMTPALQVALDLQNAGVSCGAKRHFDRAVAEGDERALGLLKQLVPPRIVGHYRKQNALACMHADGSLNKAIAGLEDRLRKRK